MAEWYTLGTRVLGQLKLVTRHWTSQLHQKMIEKKGDLVIDRSLFMMQLIVV